MLRVVLLHRLVTYPRTAFLALLLGACVLFTVVRAFATEPLISFIQPFGTNQVLVHFDTDANRTYELQFINSLPAGAGNDWSNLFVVNPLPGPDHFIVPDTCTTPQRFYRLRVTP